MTDIRFLSRGVVIMSPETAQNLARAVIESKDAFARQGKLINPAVLNAAIEIISANGTTEPTQPALEHTVEYEHITAAEAAEILGCTTRHVRALAATGRIPGDKPNSNWQFNREDIEIYRDYR